MRTTKLILIEMKMIENKVDVVLDRLNFLMKDRTVWLEILSSLTDAIELSVKKRGKR